MSKKIDPSILITHKFSLTEYREAFNALANKSDSQTVKVIFNFLND